MSEASSVLEGIGVETVRAAAHRAYKGHNGSWDVVAFKEDETANCKRMCTALKDGTWKGLLKYRSLEKTGHNGKRRKIKSPSLETRIYEVLMLMLLEPLYMKADNLNGLNCKAGCGLTARRKERSLLHRVKTLYYDRLELKWALVIDQRKCYDHVTERAFRKGLKRLTGDKWLIDFAVGVTFVGGKLPIGTPSSPFAHHVAMLHFDLWVKGIAPFSVRFADDNLLAFETKEEAQRAKWRVKNFWWYELGMRAKRQRQSVVCMDEATDFCGYVLHRSGRGRTEHGKGYTTVRRSTAERARRCAGDRSWASYFGLMKHADAFSLMTGIEKKMKLRELTAKIRIERRMDARHIEMKDLAGTAFTIYDYEVRRNAKGEANWMKCLIGVEEKHEGEPTGRTLAYEFHGNYQGLIQFVLACEETYGKEALLPMEEMEVENQCGYIFKGSTNQMEYIESEE